MPSAQDGGLKITGAREFRRAMKNMGGDLKDLSAINRAAAETVAREAKARAPEGPTGRLKKSVRPGATTKKGYVRAGGGAVVYAGPIHFGWPAHNIKPQPFIYDALDERKSEIIDRYEAHIEALVEKVGRETPP